MKIRGKHHASAGNRTTLRVPSGRFVGQPLDIIHAFLVVLVVQPFIVSSQYRGDFVQGSTERWKQLCEEAAIEKDPHKFLDLIKEINDLLEAKRLRFSGKKVDGPPSND
jgi:hypothetical protein